MLRDYHVDKRGNVICKSQKYALVILASKNKRLKDSKPLLFYKDTNHKNTLNSLDTRMQVGFPYGNMYKSEWTNTNYSYMLKQLTSEFYNLPEFNYENFPQLFSYNKRHEVYYANFLYSISFENLRPTEKFMRLYQRKAATFRFFNNVLKDDEEGQQFLRENKWAQRAFTCWLLRVGKFFTFSQQKKYKDIIHNLDYTYVLPYGVMDTKYVSEFLRSPKNDKLQIFRNSHYGYTVNIQDLMNFFYKKSCILPGLNLDARIYNKDAVPKKFKFFDFANAPSEYKQALLEKHPDSPKSLLRQLFKMTKLLDQHRDGDFLNVKELQIRTTEVVSWLYWYYNKYNIRDKNFRKLQLLKLKSI